MCVCVCVAPRYTKATVHFLMILLIFAFLQHRQRVPHICISGPQCPFNSIYHVLRRRTLAQPTWCLCNLWSFLSLPQHGAVSALMSLNGTGPQFVIICEFVPSCCLSLLPSVFPCNKANAHTAVWKVAGRALKLFFPDKMESDFFHFLVHCDKSAEISVTVILVYNMQAAV